MNRKNPDSEFRKEKIAVQKVLVWGSVTVNVLVTSAANVFHSV